MDIDRLIKYDFNKKDEVNDYNFYLLGKEIKKKRLERNLRLKDVSNDNLSISYLSKIENNKILPNIEIANELIEKFGIDDIFFSLEKEIGGLIYIFNKL